MAPLTQNNAHTVYKKLWWHFDVPRARCPGRRNLPISNSPCVPPWTGLTAFNSGVARPTVLRVAAMGREAGALSLSNVA